MNINGRIINIDRSNTSLTLHEGTSVLISYDGENYVLKIPDVIKSKIVGDLRSNELTNEQLLYLAIGSDFGISESKDFIGEINNNMGKFILKNNKIHKRYKQFLKKEFRLWKY